MEGQGGVCTVSSLLDVPYERGKRRVEKTRTVQQSIGEDFWWCCWMRIESKEPTYELSDLTGPTELTKIKLGQQDHGNENLRKKRGNINHENSTQKKSRVLVLRRPAAHPPPNKKKKAEHRHEDHRYLSLNTRQIK